MIATRAQEWEEARARVEVAAAVADDAAADAAEADDDGDTDAAADAADRAGRAHWSEAAIYHVGLHCFAGLVGLDGGGHRLDAELDAYDSGCRAGVLAPQSYRTGRPPCP